jgi:hypothetical protein
MKQKKRTQKKRPVLPMQKGGLQNAFLKNISGLFYQLYKEHHAKQDYEKIKEYVREIEKLYSKDEKEDIQKQIDEITHKMSEDKNIANVNPPNETQKEKGEKMIQNIIQELHTYRNIHKSKNVPDKIILDTFQKQLDKQKTPGTRHTAKIT